MTSKNQRRWSLVGIFAASAFFVWLGDSWLISAVPARYVGYLVAAIGVAGACGVNIWFGGPLDSRNDEKTEGTEPLSGK